MDMHSACSLKAKPGNTSSVTVSFSNVGSEYGQPGFNCDPCGRRKRNVIASRVCTLCNEYLCPDCCEGHEIFHPGPHNVVDVSGHKGKPRVNMNDIDRCKEHGRVFEYFCEDHVKLCCDKCLFFTHRRCSEVWDIESVAETNEVESMFSRTDLDECQFTILRARNMVDKNIQAIKGHSKQRMAMLKEIADKKKQVIEVFEAAKEEVLQAMTNDFDKEKTKITVRKGVASGFINELENVSSVLNDVQERGTDSQKFITLKILPDAQRRAQDGLSKLESESYFAQTSLQWNSEFLSIIDKKRKLVFLHRENVPLHIKTTEHQLQERALMLEDLSWDPYTAYETSSDFVVDGCRRKSPQNVVKHHERQSKPPMVRPRRK